MILILVHITLLVLGRVPLNNGRDTSGGKRATVAETAVIDDPLHLSILLNIHLQFDPHILRKKKQTNNDNQNTK